VVHAERRQAPEVVGGSEQREILHHASAATYPGTSATVASLHEVADLSLDLGARRAIARFPRRPAWRRDLDESDTLFVLRPLGVSSPHRCVATSVLSRLLAKVSMGIFPRAHEHGAMRSMPAKNSSTSAVQARAFSGGPHLKAARVSLPVAASSRCSW
jgi:hypothetical protein